MKWDGVRAVVHVEGGRATAWSRNDIDITDTYPELRAMAESMGRDPGRARRRDRGARPARAAQLRAAPAADARHGRGADPAPGRVGPGDLPASSTCSTSTAARRCRLPYRERRALLEELGLAGPSWQTPPAWFGGGAAVLAAAREQQLEGVVAKQRRVAATSPGRGRRSWLKVKNLRTQEVVVGGWKPGQGRRADTIGSLLLGMPDADGLRYVGKVGTGFTDRPRCMTCCDRLRTARHRRLTARRRRAAGRRPRRPLGQARGRRRGAVHRVDPGRAAAAPRLARTAARQERRPGVVRET